MPASRTILYYPLGLAIGTGTGSIPALKFTGLNAQFGGTLGAAGGSPNTVVCWKSDGKTLGYATVAEITAGTCH